MLISKAYAQAAVEVGEMAANAGTSVPAAPSPGEAFVWNMGLVLVLVALFYMLMIRPQQKRFREHTEMLDALKKGDKVITGGGLIGTVDKIKAGEPEVVVDLGGGQKVTALRSSLQSGDTPLLAKDSKGDKDSKK